MAQPAVQPATAPFTGAIGRYFEIALYLLVLTGFGTLASTGGLSLASVLLAGAAILVRGYLLATGHTLLLSARWTSRLILGYVVFFLLDYFVISGLFVQSVVHLVLFLLVVRLFSARRDRDYYFLAVIAFLMVLSAAILTVGSVFLLGFALFLLSAVAAFILLEMKSASAKAAFHFKTGDPEAHRKMARSLAGAAPVIVLLVLLGASGIFFALPRISGGYLSAYAATGSLTSGFSDRVELGGIGRIQQSAEVVMHIQIDGDENGEHELKWRGVTLSQFDGKSWTNPYRARPVVPYANGQFDLRASASRIQGRSVIHYRVLMEPVGSEVFFLAARPQSLQGNYRLIGRDYGEAVFNWDGTRSVGVYEASSDITQPSISQLRNSSGSYPSRFEGYLQTPPLDPRIPQLAAQIAASSADNYDKAVALEQYLKTHFGYTLELSRTPPRDPLANFLFERKQGHCEYFASAMAVMLRTLGIPSRVVNGFQSGEFNDVTSQYVIRASDAHSWVEAYFPNYGWISFDPTPASAAAAGQGWGRLGLYLDAMASFWREWVVNYDVAHQATLGQEAVFRGRQWLDQASRWGHRQYEGLLAGTRRLKSGMAQSPGRWAAGVALCLVFLVILRSAGWVWHWFREMHTAAKPGKSPRLAATLWYERMLRVAWRGGWRKSSTQTPQEFASSIEDRRLREKILQFTGHYENARFGGSAEDAQQLPALYEEIRATRRGETQEVLSR